MTHEILPSSRPSVSLSAVVGLTLLLSPLLTMAHELGGHAAMCLATGGTPKELGAYYIECASTDDTARRLVSMAGTGIDLVLSVLLYVVWRVVKSDLARLALWYAFVAKAMTAFGYWLFSGFTGIGDWGPGQDGGIGPLPNEMLVRAALVIVGFVGYAGIIMLARRTLRAMIGGGPDAFPAQRRIAIGFYVVNGVLAILVSVPNPEGIFITLASAAASTFGGSAGLFSVGYNRTEPPAKAFRVGPVIPLLVLGVGVALAFAVVLGPTIKL